MIFRRRGNEEAIATNTTIYRIALPVTRSNGGIVHHRVAVGLVAVAVAGCSLGGGVTPAPRGAGTPAYDIAYHLDASDTSGHRYDVRMDVGRLRGDTLELQLPVWSPGRYANMGFARNLRGFTATAGNGTPVAFDRVNGSLWRLYPGAARSVRVTYQMYSNTLSGTFSVLDTAHANFNGPSLFMYVVGHKPDSVRLTVATLPGWQLINGESGSVAQRDFGFENYDRMVDTPTELAPRVVADSFRADGRLYRVLVHHNGPEHGQRQRFVRDVEKIVRYENRVISPPPLERYTFMFHIGYEGGDGMEHLYSTQIISSTPWSDTATVLSGISTAAHEYFHTWSVKRIRPVALGPFDYSTVQWQPSLWVAEGWTQYYGQIGLLRAGVVDRASYYETLGRVIQVNSQQPGRSYVSARMSSFLAPLWDGAPPPMEADRRGSYISYYTKGDALALLLDLEIRSRSGNTRSLDDALRLLEKRTWDAPSTSYYLQGRGYTEKDIEEVVSEAAGADMHDWFERYVGGVEELPFARTLALAGLAVSSRGSGEDSEYVVEELPNATAAQLRVRVGWLNGTTSSDGR
jgi:predicted metalloprotease with PDZ domain